MRDLRVIAEDILSKERLRSYTKEKERFEDTFSLYLWNIELCQKLLPPLHFFEIGLRNRLDRAIGRLYGQEWLETIPPALSRIKDRLGRRSETPIKHADILAGQSLGFWCAFFNKQYDTILWHKSEFTKTLFPNCPKADYVRTKLVKEVRLIKSIRDRIAHHEPIWCAYPEPYETYMLCRKFLGYMASDAYLLESRLGLNQSDFKQG